MRASRVFASPRVWVPVVGVTAVLALICFAYLVAVASPEETIRCSDGPQRRSRLR
jgi:hypothetical protein